MPPHSLVLAGCNFAADKLFRVCGAQQLQLRNARSSHQPRRLHGARERRRVDGQPTVVKAGPYAQLLPKPLPAIKGAHLSSRADIAMGESKSARRQSMMHEDGVRSRRDERTGLSQAPGVLQSPHPPTRACASPVVDRPQSSRTPFSSLLTILPASFALLRPCRMSLCVAAHVSVLTCVIEYNGGSSCGGSSCGGVAAALASTTHCSSSADPPVCVLEVHPLCSAA